MHSIKNCPLLKIPEFAVHSRRIGTHFHSTSFRSTAALIVTTILLFLALPLTHAMAPGQTLKVVMDDNYPPYILRSENGNLKGILVDQWRLWEKKTGTHVEITAMDWAEAQRRMLAGEFDVIDTLFRTPKRDPLYDFSKPYAKIDVPLFFHTDISGIKNIKDARGFLVGVKAGDAVIEQLHTQGVSNISTFNSYQSIIQAARDGKIKVFTVDRPPALYFLNQMEIAERFHETPPLYSGEFHRAVRKGNTQLLAEVEHGFSKISPAEYNAIDREWKGTPIIPPSWVRYAVSFIAIATTLVLILMTWVWLLRRGIEKRTVALQRTSEYLKTVLDSVNDAIFVHDGQSGAIIDVNQAMLDMYGLTHEQALRAGVNDLSLGTPPYSQVEAFDWLTKARTKGSQTFEWVARRYRGEAFPVEVSIRYCHIGTDARYLVTVRDITERKKAAEALVASETKYRQLYESMADAFACVDMSGQIFESNSAFQALVGYTNEELSTMTYVDLTPEKWHVMESAIVHDQILPQSYSKVYEKEYRRKDGVIIPIELRTFLIRDHFGEPESMWAIVRDLSERKLLEEKRIETERQMLHTQKLESLGVMAGGIAHDFNNLLMAIQGNLDLAVMDIPPASPAIESLSNCRHAINRAADLTRQMLAYSGKGHFLIQEIDINTLVRENFHLFRTAIAKTVELKLLPGEGLSPIQADAGQVQQVIMNLITNASEALDNKAGAVTITTGMDFCDVKYLSQGRQQEPPTPGPFVWVEVTDTGCGMTEETLHRLFDPFFSTKFTGRGLGTSAILGIIHGHHGAIMVNSTPGQGTSFKVLFPATNTLIVPLPNPPAPSETLTANSPAALQTGAILLVDDEDIVRGVCKAMLNRLGWMEVIEAADGMEAVNLFRLHAATIRCAIIDLSMPRMDGMTTFKEIHSTSSETPVIIASGFNAEDIAQNFTTQGVAGFIAKPFSLEKLRAELERVVEDSAK